MANEAYTAFNDASNGYDSLVSLRASDLADLIDNVWFNPVRRSNLMVEVCRQIKEKKECELGVQKTVEEKMKRAKDYIKDTYCDGNNLPGPLMLLGDVAELMGILTETKIDWMDLLITDTKTP